MKLKRAQDAAPPQPKLTPVWPPGDAPASGSKVLFTGDTPRKKGIPAVTNADADYVVRQPFRIVVDGRVYTGGDTVSLPDTERTAFWRRARWIEPQPKTEGRQEES